MNREKAINALREKIKQANVDNINCKSRWKWGYIDGLKEAIKILQALEP